MFYCTLAPAIKATEGVPQLHTWKEMHLPQRDPGRRRGQLAGSPPTSSRSLLPHEPVRVRVWSVFLSSGRGGGCAEGRVTVSLLYGQD